MSSSEIFSPFSLVWPTVIFRHVDYFVMLLISFWCVWRFVFVCLVCLHYVNIPRTHTQSCKHCCASFISNIWRSITSVALIALNSKKVQESLAEGMFHLIVMMVYVVSSSSMISVCSQCESAQFVFFWHLVIFLIIYPNEKPYYTRPQLRCTAQSQPSITLLYYPELRSAWGYPLAQLHYAIPNVSNLSASKNCAKNASLSKWIMNSSSIVMSPTPCLPRSFTSLRPRSALFPKIVRTCLADHLLPSSTLFPRIAQISLDYPYYLALPYLQKLHRNV